MNKIENTIRYYQKRPLVIEAIRFTGQSKDRCFNFVTCNKSAGCADESAGGIEEPVMEIQTREGKMTARLGDWIIKGVKGEFYPCKDEIFQETYSLYQPE